MPLSDEAKDYMLDQFAANKGLFVSAHTADPGTTGANEVFGGSYARKSITWGSSSGGAIDSSNAPEIDIPGGNTVAYVGFWAHVSSTAQAEWMGSYNVTDEVFAGDGTYTVDDADIDLNA